MTTTKLLAVLLCVGYAANASLGMPPADDSFLRDQG